MQFPHYIPLFEKGIHWTIQDVGGQVSRVSTLSPGTVKQGWQAARAPDRRYRVACIVPGFPSRPEGYLWSAVLRVGFLAEAVWTGSRVGSWSDLPP